MSRSLLTKPRKKFYALEAAAVRRVAHLALGTEVTGVGYQPEYPRLWPPPWRITSGLVILYVMALPSDVSALTIHILLPRLKYLARVFLTFLLNKKRLSMEGTEWYCHQMDTSQRQRPSWAHGAPHEHPHGQNLGLGAAECTYVSTFTARGLHNKRCTIVC